MIQRFIFMRLQPEYADQRAEIADYARTVLARLPGVHSVSVGIPADEHANKAWDLGITVCFASLTDVATYRVDPDHRAFVDDYLAPRVHVIKAWNFESPDAG